MSGIVERTYLNLISSSHDRFRWVNGTDVANCRCRLCGDSTTSKIKARGYFYYSQKMDMFFYKCHRCGASMSFTKYLKQEFPHYSKEMRLDKFTFKHGPRVKQEKPKARDIPKLSRPMPVFDEITRGLIPLTDLDEHHIAVVYAVGRNIPKAAYSKLYYVADYGEWVKSWLDVGDLRYPNDERIVMLMKDKDGVVFGAQGRALGHSPLRYSTVKRDDDNPKVFGLDSVDYDMPIFVLEGVFDSFFIPNSVAICGGDVGQSIKTLPRENIIIILDNEPRSQDTINRMERAIKSGYKIVIWNGVKSDYKDITEMILGGIHRRDILKIISANIYSGTAALVRLNMWKRT